MAILVVKISRKGCKIRYFLAKKQHSQRINCFPLSMWSFGQIPDFLSLPWQLAIPSRVKSQRNANSLDETILDYIDEKTK